MEILRKVINGIEYTEEWKDVVGYEGYYKISSFGRVKRVKNNRLLKPRINTTGYNQVALCVNCNVKFFCVHKLVAIAFIHNYEPLILTDANHIDENRANDFFLNLEWMTRRQNKNYSVSKRSFSKYHGVSWHKKGKKWVASAKMNGVSNYLGLHETESDAHDAYVNFCKSNNLR